MNRPLACCALLLLTGVAFARSGSTFGAVPQDSPAKAPPPVRIDIESQVWPTDPAVVESARTGKTPLTAIGALRTPRALVLSGLATNGTGGQPVAPGDLRILPPGGYQFVVDFGSNGLTATIDDHPAPSKDDLVFGRRDVGGFRLRPLTPVAAAAGGTAPLSVDASTAGVVTVRWGPFGGDFELGTLDWHATDALPFGGQTIEIGVAAIPVGTDAWAFDDVGKAEGDDGSLGPLGKTVRIADAGRLLINSGGRIWSWKIALTADPQRAQITLQNVDSRKPQARESVTKLETELQQAEVYLQQLKDHPNEDPQARQRALARAEHRVGALREELQGARSKISPPSSFRDDVQIALKPAASSSPTPTLDLSATKTDSGVHIRFLLRNGTFEADLKPSDFIRPDAK